MRHELIVCTKDRPDDLARCLASVSEQSVKPDRVLVVDGSETTSESRIRDAAVVEGLCLEVVRTAAGLTYQRNEGLKRLLPETDVVHFVDDDSVLEPDYCAQILSAFAPGVAAVGGRITNLPPHAPTPLQCKLGLDSRRQGALLRSGVNVLNYSGDAVRDSDWLSGCSMSYRRSCIIDMSFDESRRGGGFGEDVDFSARCRTRGRVVWTPHAAMEHRQSALERPPDGQVIRRWIRSRGKLAYDGVGGVRLTFVLLGALAEAALVAVWAIRDRDRLLGRKALALLRGTLDVVARKPV